MLYFQRPSVNRALGKPLGSERTSVVRHQTVGNCDLDAPIPPMSAQSVYPMAQATNPTPLPLATNVFSTPLLQHLRAKRKSRPDPLLDPANLL